MENNNKNEYIECECGKWLQSKITLKAHQHSVCHTKAMDEKGTYKELRRKIKLYLKEGRGTEISRLIETFIERGSGEGK